jgi:hypothetical protein
VTSRPDTAVTPPPPATEVPGDCPSCGGLLGEVGALQVVVAACRACGLYFAKPEALERLARALRTMLRHRMELPTAVRSISLPAMERCPCGGALVATPHGTWWSCTVCRLRVVPFGSARALAEHPEFAFDEVPQRRPPLTPGAERLGQGVLVLLGVVLVGLAGWQLLWMGSALAESRGLIVVSSPFFEMVVGAVLVVSQGLKLVWDARAGSEVVRRCSHCHNPLEETQSICDVCGTSLGEDR